MDFIEERQQKKLYIQAAYVMTDESTIVREFGSYDCIQDNYPKYVISLDEIQSDRDGG